jgi:integrase
LADRREFTDRFLRAIKPTLVGKRVIKYDAQVPGFGIRVTDKSSEAIRGAFVLVARFPGSNNPVPRRIGDYPEMSLSDARAVAMEWREDLRKGVDPKIKKAEKERVEARRKADTFEAAFHAFADDHLSTLRTGAAVKSSMARHVLPKWGDKPISEIRRADVAELVRTLRKSMPIGTNRILAYIKKMFVWLIDQDMIEASPAASIKRPAKETKRDRVLTEAEIRAIWNACGELGPIGRAFKLMLVTAQRRSEVGSMTWSEVDRKKAVWTLPRGRTKADRAHEIPLSSLALEIIEEGPRLNEYVFSSGRGVADKNGGPSRPRPVSGWGKSKAKLDALVVKNAKNGAEESGEEPPDDFQEWHLHDLRRTAATNMAKLGADRVVIAKVLNHAETEVTAVYDRHRYDREKRQALDLWAERLRTIVSGSDDSNVVSISKGRG